MVWEHGGETELGGCGGEGVPVEAREDVLYEGGVEGAGVLLELGVAEVERVGGGGGFAGFDGAGEEVCCEEFHCG